MKTLSPQERLEQAHRNGYDSIESLIVVEYLMKQKPMKKVADMLGISTAALEPLFKKYNVKPRSGVNISHLKCELSSKTKIMVYAYHEQGLKQSVIADRLDIGVASVRLCLQEYYTISKNKVNIKCIACGKKRLLNVEYAKKLKREGKQTVCKECRKEQNGRKKVVEKIVQINGCRLFNKYNSRCAKNIRCQHYKSCLNYTSKHNWEGWDCEEISE